MSWCRSHSQSGMNSAPTQEPLFQLTYEKKPFGINCDYKLWVKSASLEVVYNAEAARWAQQLWVKSASLEVVYNAEAARWAQQWVCAPWAHAYAHVRDTTRARLRTQWEHMMHAHQHPGERRTWQVELDISAPQILFVEQLTSRDSAVLVVDFGRLRLANANLSDYAPHTPPADDEEMFMTPCSTPPGSLLSPGSPPEPPPQLAQPALDAANLHNRLYDRYKIELSDLQILVGRARDNWKYAHTKSTSSLHLLDRFSILLQAERRVVHTSDPQYPTATVCGSLPALVVHLSEQKLFAVRAVFANSALLGTNNSRECASPMQAESDDIEEDSVSSETERSEFSQHHNSTLFMLQFAIEQMSLEVQSMGRSIAEVQVCGVKAAATARPRDLSLSLSVHSLLLVDALQTYGPDFELLVASHKHVGMDTLSGSIRGSEPCSPTSPTSPTSPVCPSSPDARSTHALAHPHALHQALNSLHCNNKNEPLYPAEPSLGGRASPGAWAAGTGLNWNGSGMFGAGWGAAWSAAWSAVSWGPAPAAWGAAGLVDSEALIAVDLCLVKGDGDNEDLRIANILFNNLDIIANQETIVELIGFTQRVLGPKASAKKHSTDLGQSEPAAAAPFSYPIPEDEPKKEVRTEITFDFHRLGVLLLRAAVHEGNVVARKIATATISEAKIQATVDGSRVEVGGSLGGVGVVSLCEGGGLHTRVLCAGHARAPDAHQAHDTRTHDGDDAKALLFTIHRTVATRSDAEAPVVEATVSLHVASVWYTHSGPLLRELRSCLTEFKQYLANLARSIRAAAADMAIGLVHPRGESLYANPKLSQSMEGVSPRRRTVSLGTSLDEPPSLKSDNIVLSVNIELESPVVVVPRNAHSTQVFVAHLGRMALANRPGPPHHTLYKVRVRDISLAAVDVADKLKVHQLSSENMADIYDVTQGKPVLHNTALRFTVNYADTEADTDADYQCEVRGKIVGGLHVSARREQYEQLLETLRWISSDAPADVVDSEGPHSMPSPLSQVRYKIVGGLHVSARREQYEQLLETLRWISSDAPADVVDSEGPHSMPSPLSQVRYKIVGGLHVSARREQYEQLLETLRWISSDAPADVVDSEGPHSMPSPLSQVRYKIVGGLHVSARREQYEQLLETLRWISSDAPADVVDSEGPHSMPSPLSQVRYKIVGGLHVSARREQYEQLLETLRWISSDAPADVVDSEGPHSMPSPLSQVRYKIVGGLHVSARREQYEQLLETLRWISSDAPADVVDSEGPHSMPSPLSQVRYKIVGGLHVSARREQYEQLLETLRWISSDAPADVVDSEGPHSMPSPLSQVRYKIVGGLHVSARREQYEQLLETLRWISSDAPADVVDSEGPHSMPSPLSQVRYKIVGGLHVSARREQYEQLLETLRWISSDAPADVVDSEGPHSMPSPLSQVRYKIVGGLHVSARREQYEQLLETLRWISSDAPADVVDSEGPHSMPSPLSQVRYKIVGGLHVSARREQYEQLLETLRWISSDAPADVVDSEGPHSMPSPLSQVRYKIVGGLHVSARREQYEQLLETLRWISSDAPADVVDSEGPHSMPSPLSQVRYKIVGGLHVSARREQYEQLLETLRWISSDAPADVVDSEGPHSMPSPLSQVRYKIVGGLHVSARREQYEQLLETLRWISSDAPADVVDSEGPHSMPSPLSQVRYKIVGGLHVSARREQYEQLLETLRWISSDAPADVVDSEGPHSMPSPLSQVRYKIVGGLHVSARREQYEQLLETLRWISSDAPADVVDSEGPHSMPSPLSQVRYKIVGGLHVSARREQYEQLLETLRWISSDAPADVVDSEGPHSMPSPLSQVRYKIVGGLHVSARREQYEQLLETLRWISSDAPADVVDSEGPHSMPSPLSQVRYKIVGGLHVSARREQYEQLLETLRWISSDAPADVVDSEGPHSMPSPLSQVRYKIVGGLHVSARREQYEQLLETLRWISSDAPADVVDSEGPHSMPSPLSQVRYKIVGGLHVSARREQYEQLLETLRWISSDAPADVVDSEGPHSMPSPLSQVRYKIVGGLHVSARREQYEQLLETLRWISSDAPADVVDSEGPHSMPSPLSQVRYKIVGGLHVSARREQYEQLLETLRWISSDAPADVVDSEGPHSMPSPLSQVRYKIVGGLHVSARHEQYEQLLETLRWISSDAPADVVDSEGPHSMPSPLSQVRYKIVGGLHVSARREQYEQLLETLRWISSDAPADVVDSEGPHSMPSPLSQVRYKIVGGLHVSARREQYEQLLETLRWISSDAPADVVDSEGPHSMPSPLSQVRYKIVGGLHVSARREQYEQLLETLRWISSDAPADVVDSEGPHSMPSPLSQVRYKIVGGLHVSARREQYEQLLETLRWISSDAPADVVDSEGPHSMPSPLSQVRYKIVGGLHVSARREQYEQLLETLRWISSDAPADVVDSEGPHSMPSPLSQVRYKIVGGLHVSARREQYEQLLETLRWISSDAPADVVDSEGPHSMPSPLSQVRYKIVGGLHVSARREQYEQLLETLRWISSDAPADVVDSEGPHSMPSPLSQVRYKIVGGLHVSARREQYEQLLETLRWISSDAPADVVDSEGPHSMPSPLSQVRYKIVGGLHVSARREQYEQLLETLRWISSDAPADVVDSEGPHSMPSPLSQVAPSDGAAHLLDSAVPTLQLDPAVRATVLAVPPPAHPAAPTRPQAQPSVSPLIVNFELPTFSVELRADLGEGERSLVELSFREFKLNYQKTHPYENMLQVSLHSITMEDLTKDPESKHRMLMVSHTPQVPPKAVFVSKSCPAFVTDSDDLASVSSLQYMKCWSCSLPSQLNVPAKESLERRKTRDSTCGVTPPCSPELGADEESGARTAEPGDNLVWLSVHTREPQHPHFSDKYDKVTCGIQSSAARRRRARRSCARTRGARAPPSPATTSAVRRDAAVLAGAVRGRGGRARRRARRQPRVAVRAHARAAAPALQRQVRQGNVRHTEQCGATPPCSPELCADEGGARAAEPGDNLVWLSVHTREPQHPHFSDKYDKVTCGIQSSAARRRRARRSCARTRGARAPPSPATTSAVRRDAAVLAGAVRGRGGRARRRARRQPRVAVRAHARAAAPALQRQVRQGNVRHTEQCGATPPCSPELCADEGGARAAEPGDNLVWLSVHTREPQHPHFSDKYDKVTCGIQSSAARRRRARRSCARTRGARAPPSPATTSAVRRDAAVLAGAVRGRGGRARRRARRQPRVAVRAHARAAAPALQRQVRQGNVRHTEQCGATPPCSPELCADEGGARAAEPGDNLVWLSVHTREPQHPHFSDKYDKISKLTKVDFNCLNLVVSIDSWVAVLDFFGVAGDDVPDSEQGPEPQQTASHNLSALGGITQTEMSVRSLSVVVVAGRGEACRALVSRARTVARADARAHTRHIAGRLGAIALTDLTPHSALWRDRFRTHGDQALTFQYERLSTTEAASAGHETSLSIEMGPVTYVHTKRFVQELQAFARDFSLLRRVILQARLKVSVVSGGSASSGGRLSRMKLRLRCSAPVIVLPVSGRARNALAAHLDHLTLDNSFKYAGDEGTVSTMTDPNCANRELLDVRVVRLSGVSLWCARGGRGLRVRRVGAPLLHAPADLDLQIEHNLHHTHNVADMTLQGSLSTLQLALDPAQYRVLRGVLAHNLADSADELLPPAPPQPLHPQQHQEVWTTSSLKLDLHDVTVKLEPEHGVSSLACINFIKSRLVVETYSDLSQDIDLVSQEILVSDTRYAKEPANCRGNVFSNIVQPMPEQRHSVQAEVHARKRRESSAYTILVNNMRLMAVLDWWECANQFIMQPPPPPADPDQQHLEEALNMARRTASSALAAGAEPAVELKLNVTDSQLVLVEDPSVWDTNAVILRSTTVITYRCADAAKPVSCELNELEVFSCVLGLEEETALSIVEPAAVHVAIDANRVLHVRGHIL
ncbi:hypothetical protein PYW07_004211 [Mythimna separata]|uniref:Uncharacterized protein n=1 Tax=Mythimna separata TaxID=271217 RepID=A0AAD8DUV6_MYTSE|nr:hypothetical protein PYW07_004211 [Mythimna separata]